MEKKKKMKKMTSTWLKVTLTQEKQRKKSFETPNHAFVLSYVLYLFQYFLFFILYHYLYHFHYL